MREKILAQLLTARGQNTTPSQRTLETLATTLSAKITEETQIDAAIENFKQLFVDFNGEKSHYIAEAIKELEPTVPPVVPPITITPPLDPTEPAWFTAFKLEQAQKVADIETKFTGIQQKEAADKLVISAKEKFSKTYNISDSEKALLDKSIAIALKLNPNHENVDSLVAGIKSEYEDLRSAVGLGGIEPIQSNGGGGGEKKKPMMKMLTDQLKKEGKIPTPQNQD